MYNFPDSSMGATYYEQDLAQHRNHTQSHHSKDNHNHQRRPQPTTFFENYNLTPHKDPGIVFGQNSFDTPSNKRSATSRSPTVTTTVDMVPVDKS